MDNLKEQFDNHVHDGKSGKRLNGKYLIGAPQSALTPASGGTLSSGGTEDMTNTDAAILNNLITRVGELETKLQNLNLIQ